MVCKELSFWHIPIWVCIVFFNGFVDYFDSCMIKVGLTWTLFNHLNSIKSYRDINISTLFKVGYVSYSLQEYKRVRNVCISVLWRAEKNEPWVRLIIESVYFCLFYYSRYSDKISFRLMFFIKNVNHFGLTNYEWSENCLNLSNKLDFGVGKQQGRFQPNRYCVNQMNTLRIIFDQSSKWRSLVDYSIAFENVIGTLCNGKVINLVRGF